MTSSDALGETATRSRTPPSVAPDRCAQLAALTRSSTLPSMSSMPGGTAGYHLMFFSAASGKLFANCAFSFASISWSAPLRRGEVAGRRRDLRGDLGPHVEVDPRVGGGVVAALRRQRERVDPAERAGLRRDELDVGILAVQLPAARVPHHRADDLAGAHAVQQLVLVVPEELDVALARGERLADVVHQRRVGLRDRCTARTDPCRSANAKASSVGRFRRMLVLPLYSALHRSG